MYRCEMTTVPPGFLKKNIDLTLLNTFQLPARAAWFVEVTDPDEIRECVIDGYCSGLPKLVLGGGSNIILTRDFSGLVIKVAIRGYELIHETENYWVVQAGGGENWHQFVQWTLKQGYWGLENLSLIPGTVGAAPVQNIGAYGLELAERFDSLDAIHLETGENRIFDRELCQFAYRESFFKQHAGQWVITHVRFRLDKCWQPMTRYAELERFLSERAIEHPDALDIADAVISIRRAKLPDPQKLGNAGSFFKNPVVTASVFSRMTRDYPGLPHYLQPDGTIKLAAGWMIDQAGWKGRSLGPAGCFEHQALIVVNHGGAQGTDIECIAETIRQDVYARFGVMLETEPVFI